MLCSHRGDSNEYKQYTVINMKKKGNHPYYHTYYDSVCSYHGIFSLGLKNEFEIVVVTEPSVFEPLKFYCISELSLFL